MNRLAALSVIQREATRPSLVSRGIFCAKHKGRRSLRSLLLRQSIEKLAKPSIARLALIGHDLSTIDLRGHMRKFLVVLDDSRECLNAMRFAAMRAAHTGGGVTILSIIPPDEFNHWIGVGEVMREEARERIEVHFEVFAKWMRDRQQIEPELVIREGEALPEIMAQIEEDTEIGVLVLGAGTDRKGPGPLVSQLSRGSTSLPVPVTIVPGDISKEKLEAIT